MPSIEEERRGWLLWENPETAEIEIFPSKETMRRRIEFCDMMAGIPEIGK